ncbi:MAG: hypothetical protein LBB61_03000 [Treponema sp.]|nr:hypothetical protein [Treponema sp.]
MKDHTNHLSHGGRMGIGISKEEPLGAAPRLYGGYTPRISGATGQFHGTAGCNETVTVRLVTPKCSLTARLGAGE